MRDLLAKAYSASREIGTWAGAGFPVAHRDNRLAICRVCEHFENNHCKVCSCFMPVKAALATSSCPLGKWAAVQMGHDHKPGCGCGG